MDGDIIFRNPKIDDGAAIWRIVKDSGILDPNSAYLYLLLCKDFTDTCVVAERGTEVVGFVTGYRPPGRESAIFLWQVGVAESCRGQGLGKRLLAAFLRNPGARGATLLETTISPSNKASQALFKAVARDLGTNIERKPCFSASQFPEAGHEDEDLYLIGPYDLTKPNQLCQ